MTLNFPGPYQVRIFYTITLSSVPFSHVQALNLELDGDPLPGDAFSTITPMADGSPMVIALDDVIDNWVLDMKAMYSNAGGNTIDRAELWRYDAGTFDATFISAYSLGIAGTSVSSTQQAAQSIVTMRTKLGGIFKLSFMETVIAPAAVDGGTILNAALESLVSDIEAADYPWIGRDGGQPFVRIAHYPGTNEQLWKRRFGRKT